MDRLTQNRRPLIAEMNVVPYIDVMLVLLVLFIATAPMWVHGIEMRLPIAKAKPVEIAQKTIVIELRKDDTIVLTRAGRSQSTDRAQLGQMLAKTSDGGQPLIEVRADRRLAYQSVVNLLALLQQMGLTKIALETDQPA